MHTTLSCGQILFVLYQFVSSVSNRLLLPRRCLGSAGMLPVCPRHLYVNRLQRHRQHDLCPLSSRKLLQQSCSLISYFSLLGWQLLPCRIMGPIPMRCRILLS